MEYHKGTGVISAFADRLGSPVHPRDRTVLFCFLFILSQNFQEAIKKKVAIIMGSDRDLPVLESAIKTLQQFDVPMEVRVLSAHRTPVEAADFARNARANGFGAIIAAAGKAAHLAGAMAAGTTLPVIGIPVKSSTLDGLDALLSTVQMPSGMPVATVAIDGAANAALLAIQILAVSDAALADKLEAFRKENSEKVLAKDAKISAEYSTK